MKKLLFSLIFVGIGVFLWFLLSQTANYSFKKWDATFANALRHELKELGLSDADILSSVHKIQKDARGQWITEELTIKLPKEKSLEDLKRSLENSGAELQEKIEKGKKSLLIKRGNRVFQDIHIEPL